MARLDLRCMHRSGINVGFDPSQTACERQALLETSLCIKVLSLMHMAWGCYGTRTRLTFKEHFLTYDHNCPLTFEPKLPAHDSLAKFSLAVPETITTSYKVYVEGLCFTDLRKNNS